MPITTNNPDMDLAQINELHARTKELQSRIEYTQADIRCRDAQTQQYYVDSIINLVRNGFTAQSAIDAVVSNDLTKLTKENA